MHSSEHASPIGAQRPRILHLPDHVASQGQEAIELCEMAGLHLDPWQQFVLTNSLNTRLDGKLAAMLVGLCVGRQNGKGSIVEGRELAGLFLRKEERTIIHSAHQFDTSLEHFNRILYLIESTPDLDKQVKRVSRSHGEEGIELKDRSRIRFRTRNKGGGRGFTGDLLILDEAMVLAEAFFGALMPTLSARSITGSPQVWIMGSAVDQQIFDDGVVFSRIRESGIAGTDPSLAYFEWSALALRSDGQPVLTPDDLEEHHRSDPALIAQANPGMGIRIAFEHIMGEMRSMGWREYATERLGIGDWPDPDPNSGGKIKMEAWKALQDRDSSAQDPISFAYDVSEDRKWSTIAASGLRDDKMSHIEVVERQDGTEWVPKRLKELTKNHKTAYVLTHATGPGASLIRELEHLGVKVEAIPTNEYVKACGLLFDVVERQTLRHLGQPEMAIAIKGAADRQIDDAWAWSRKNSNVDISPLVAGTLAHWGATEYRPTYRVAGF